MKDGKLEIGDKLYYNARYGGGKKYAGIVDRVSKTMAFCGKTRINREYKNGAWSVGGGDWDRTVYFLADEAIINEIKDKQKRSKLIYRCSKIDFGSVSNDGLEMILILAGGHKEVS